MKTNPVTKINRPKLTEQQKKAGYTILRSLYMGRWMATCPRCNKYLGTGTSRKQAKDLFYAHLKRRDPTCSCL